MSWTGRKRASTQPRKPCGRLKPRKPSAPPSQPHRKGYGSNPLAETQHGRYLLDGVINGPQHLAGTFYGRSRLRYRAAIGSPDSLRGRSDGHPAGSGENDAEDISAYLGARTALGHFIADVEWVICQDALLADLSAYRAGLDTLRRFYGV